MSGEHRITCPPAANQNLDEGVVFHITRAMPKSSEIFRLAKGAGGFRSAGSLQRDRESSATSTWTKTALWSVRPSSMHSNTR